MHSGPLVHLITKTESEKCLQHLKRNAWRIPQASEEENMEHFYDHPFLFESKSRFFETPDSR